MESLQEIFDSHEGRLLNKWHHYLDIYERYFSSYRNRPITILEIGVSHGGSLQMWRRYFGPQAKIYGVDINPECKKFEDENIQIFIGSQEDATFLSELKEQLPPLDILLDDGGHTMKQQILTFNILFSKVKDGGIYMVEDTHSSYWYKYDGGYKKSGTFIEFSKDIVDQMHAWHTDNPRQMPVTTLTENINAISFYDSIVVFEKKKRTKPAHSMKGRPSIEPFVEVALQKNVLWKKLQKALNPRTISSYFRKRR